MKKIFIIGLLGIGGYYLYSKNKKTTQDASSGDTNLANATRNVLEAEKYLNTVTTDCNIKFKEWNRLVDLRWKQSNDTNIENMFAYKPIIDAAIVARNLAVKDVDAKRLALKNSYGIGGVFLGGM